MGFSLFLGNLCCTEAAPSVARAIHNNIPNQITMKELTEAKTTWDRGTLHAQRSRTVGTKPAQEQLGPQLDRSDGVKFYAISG